MRKETNNKSKGEQTKAITNLEKWLLGTNTVLAAVGIIAAFIYFCQLRVTIANFAADQRPYIWTHRTALSPENNVISYKDGKLFWTFHYTNFGKSPAIGYQVDEHVAVGPNAMSEVKWTDIPKDSHDSRSILPPGDDNFTSAKSLPISQDVAAVVLQSDQQIVLFGHFDYWGMDGSYYSSEFCAFRLHNGNIASCESHNGMK